MIVLRTIARAALLALLAAPALAAEVSISARVEPASITVGDPVTYSIVVRAPEGLELTLPPAGVELGEFFIRDANAAQPVIENGEQVIRAEYIITTYVVGTSLIPPYPVGWTDEAGEQEVLVADPIAVEVRSVAGGETEIRAMKPPVEIPVDWYAYWPWAAGALAAIGAIVAAILFLRRKREPEEEVLPPPIPEDEEALAALERIAAERMLEDGRPRDHYFAVSEVLRRYVGRRWEVLALEQTVGEIEHNLRLAGTPEPLIETVVELEREADMAKYAKTLPDDRIRQTFLPRVRALVLETRRPREEDQGAPGGEPDAKEDAA